MVLAHDFDALTPTLAIWHAYDSAVKVELFSTAFKTRAGIYFVDPISLGEDALNELVSGERAAGIIVTNGNHERASNEFSRRFHTKVWSGETNISGLGKIDNDIRVIAIEGAASGEIALCVERTLIMGDALINFPPAAFTLLPVKYCLDQKQMRRSLGQLLDLDFNRIVFAHGEPITANARERLARLLEDPA